MKALRYLFIFFVLIGIAGSIAYLIYDEPMPVGEEGLKAESLVDEVLLAVNDSAWQATTIVSWDHQNEHQYVWDKKRHLAKVSWDQYDVFVDLSKQTGKAYANGKAIKDSTATAEFIEKAYGFWINDSFWLNPLTKMRDQGTSRSWVELDNPNQSGLLVSYSTGGLTPGDSYLWIVDMQSKRPLAVQMWVSIIPIGGVKFSWEEYVKTETGAIVSTYHKGPIEVFIYDLKTYSSIDTFDAGDIFSVLE